MIYKKPTKMTGSELIVLCCGNTYLATLTMKAFLDDLLKYLKIDIINFKIFIKKYYENFDLPNLEEQNEKQNYKLYDQYYFELKKRFYKGEINPIMLKKMMLLNDVID